MKSHTRRAIGNFLVYYQWELEYINAFQQYKYDRNDGYLSTCKYSFNGFLGLFSVARNRSRIDEKQSQLLTEAVEWCDKGYHLDVDDFALHIRDNGITFGKLCVSLSSKILFLNDPLSISPYDQRAKKAIEFKGNNYKEFRQKIDLISRRDDVKEEIELISDRVKEYAEGIESESKGRIEQIEDIRERRILDKLLWAKGGN